MATTGRQFAGPARRRVAASFWLPAFLLLCSAPRAVAAPEVDARIVRVGLFAGANPVIRAGTWSFVEVELRYLGQGTFDGEIRIEQPDRDGDIATSITPVALASGADWRPYQVYLVPRSGPDVSHLRVKVFRADGRQARLRDETGVETAEIRGPIVADLRAEDYLIVDLTSPRRLEHVAFLDSDLRKQQGFNARQVRSMAPRELPPRWYGLEAVDAIVWDDADPSDLAPQQAQALVDWVRQGGRLLLSASKNWQLLASSPLAEALPVTLTGVSETNEGQEFTPVIRDESYAEQLERQYAKKPFRRCKMTPGAGAIPVPAVSSLPQVVYRRLLGRGSLVFLGASLRDLLPPPKRYANTQDNEEKGGDPDDDFVKVACERVVARRLLGLPPLREDPRQANMNLLNVPDLFEMICRTIAFESVGAAFLLFAILFAVGYTLTAAFGSFWYMKRRNWPHHAWTAFAAVSLLASAAAGGMVIVLRGFSDDLWQTSIVDGRAGEIQAQATALFGLKTHDHTRLDVRLPGLEGQDAPAESRSPIRVMPRAEEFGMEPSHFVASERYGSTFAGTLLTNVPIRATLRQFQGRWDGALNGTLNAKLVMRRQAGRDEVDEGSFIENNLGVNLTRCFILETGEELAGEDRVVLCRCLDLGDLPKAGEGAHLAWQEIRRRLYEKPESKSDSDNPTVRNPPPLAVDALSTWVSMLGTIRWQEDEADSRAARFTADQEYAALLVLSFMNMARPDASRRFDLTRSLGRGLDCSHEITRTTAVLVAYSEDPAPVTLEVDRVNLEPARSRTIYRFVIPVERKEN